MSVTERDAPFSVHARPAIEQAIERAIPGARVVDIETMLADDAGADVTTKAAGYGEPLSVRAEAPDGSTRRFVFHTASANVFGHDRRADRAAEMLLAFDTFADIPDHVAALDVGAIHRDGSGLLSLHDAGEFYLLTEYAEGHVYAEDLRRIATGGAPTDTDRERARRLARYLGALHSKPVNDPVAYRRSVRDLVGSGEGIYGMIDGFPDDVPGAPIETLFSLERKAARYRERLRGGASRLRTIHGDFHPFNIVIGPDGSIAPLDASRGCRGDPADDATCLAINYVFFAIEHKDAWSRGLRTLWFDFWETYLEPRGADAVLTVAPPFVAWRALVLVNPVWYPGVHEEARKALLAWTERALDAGRFDPHSADELFT